MWGVTTQVSSRKGLSEEMAEEGFSHITNIDASMVVIQQMLDKQKDRKYSNLKCGLFNSPT